MGEILVRNIIITQDILISFLISMILVIGLGLAIATIYRLTHRGMSYEGSFLATLVILPAVVTLVMFFIQGDLVLSLGLVGSLSIIRFRTPIKDTRDMVFLFWSIAIGLGVGTLNWTTSILATLIIGLLLGIFYLIKYGRSFHAEYILIVIGDGRLDEASISKHIKKEKLNFSIRSQEFEGDSFELVYEIRLERKDFDELQRSITNIRSHSGIRRVSLLSPQLQLPM